MDTLLVMIERVQNYRPRANNRQQVIYRGKIMVNAKGTDLIG